MAAAPTLAWLFVGRAIAGVAGATFGPAGAVIADVTPPEKRAADLRPARRGVRDRLHHRPGAGRIGRGASDTARRSSSPRSSPAPTRSRCCSSCPRRSPRETAARSACATRNVIGAFRPLFAAGNAAPLLVAWFLWQLGGDRLSRDLGVLGAIRFGWTRRAIGWSLAWVGLLQLLVQLGADRARRGALRRAHAPR